MSVMSSAFVSSSSSIIRSIGSYDVWLIKIRPCPVFGEEPPNEAKIKNSTFCKALLINYLYGRGDRIRTCDFYTPSVALYQAELRPDISLEVGKATMHPDAGQREI